MWQKGAVETDHANEFLKLSDSRRPRKVTDGLDFAVHRCNSLRGDDVAQKGDGRDAEHTLVASNDKTSVAKDAEDGAEVAGVVLRCLRGHQEVVNEAEDEGKVAEELVHQFLEGSAAIPHTERHVKERKSTEWSGDSRLGYVFLLDWDLEVALQEVEL
jgi:hypothetical protein